MATTLSDSGDTIRDQAEEAGKRLLAAKELVMEMLIKAPVEPREVMRFAGRVLQELEEASAANEQVKAIIYEARRRK